MSVKFVFFAEIVKKDFERVDENSFIEFCLNLPKAGMAVGESIYENWFWWFIITPTMGKINDFVH